jgi:hypothetical protein
VTGLPDQVAPVVVAFDSGRVNCGWSALRIVSPTKAAALGCGVLDRGMVEAREILARFRPFAVGVELPKRAFPKDGFGPRMAGNLIQAARVGGRLEEAAEATGAVVHAFEADIWRGAIMGAAQATDDMVATWVRRRIAGWPVDASSHENDAGGAAIYTYELVRLPPQLVRSKPAVARARTPRPRSR